MPNLDEFLENPESADLADVRSDKQKLLDAAEAIKSKGECFDCSEYCSCGTINGLLQHAEKMK